LEFAARSCKASLLGDSDVEQAKTISRGLEQLRGLLSEVYTQQNKKWVIALSFLLVLALNASLITIYEITRRQSKSYAGHLETFHHSKCREAGQTRRCGFGRRIP